MKNLFYLLVILLLPHLVKADAGPNIGRPKAPCFAVFSGIDNLPEFEFFKIINRGNGSVDEIDSTDKITNGEKVRIYYEQGEKRWHGPITIFVRNKITNQMVDSFILNADGYNLNIKFSTPESGKPKYTIEKTKAEYPYQLFGTDEINDTATAKRNKYILISLSAIGFLILFFMFTRRKAADKTEPA